MDLEAWKIPVIFLNCTALSTAGTVRVNRDEAKHLTKITLTMDDGTSYLFDVQSTTTLEICRCSKSYYSLSDKDWTPGVELPQQAHWLRVSGLLNTDADADPASGIYVDGVRQDEGNELHLAWYLMRDWTRLQRLAGEIIVEEKVHLTPKEKAKLVEKERKKEEERRKGSWWERNVKKNVRNMDKVFGF